MVTQNLKPPACGKYVEKEWGEPSSGEEAASSPPHRVKNSVPGARAMVTGPTRVSLATPDLLSGQCPVTTLVASSDSYASLLA